MKHPKILGFTLIELVVVILMIGIISVSVVPLFTARSVNVEYETRHILDDIRYTQALSLTTGFRYRWVRTASNTYQIIDPNGNAIILPSGSTTYTLQNGINFGTFSNLPSNLIIFDAEGTPYTTTGSPGTALASAALIPILSASHNRTITIQPTTGSGEIT